MSDTHSLLKRIAAFRERLESTPPLIKASVEGEPAITGSWLASRADLIAPLIRQFADVDANAQPLPPHITTRVRQLLHDARELVATQRTITDDVFFIRLASGNDDGSEHDPLVRYHRGTVAATDAALRLTQSFPASAEFQTRMCDGLETMLKGVRDRLFVANRALDQRRRDWGRIERVARLLCDVQARRLVSYSSFADVAEEIIADARQGVPLRFPTAPASSVARFIATHAVTAAQVVARLAPHDYEWASHAITPVAAALMMDVGMLAVSPEILVKTTDLEPADRSAIEAHAAAGAELLRNVMPEIGIIGDAVAAHHECLDGTGYPYGLKGEQISSLARLLAVADTYAAAAADRPHRPAHEPRAALTETLTQAETGRLDKDFAELLLNLSFHPIGTVIELTDGRVGVVVATHTSRANLRATTRPVVAVLADVTGAVLPRPEVVDLATAEFGGVLRALTTAERRRLLCDCYPDLC